MRLKLFKKRNITLLFGGQAIKKAYNPNAYLQKIRNVETGLKVRTVLLGGLEKRSSDAGSIARESSLSYRVVLHHLKLLKNEGTVSRKGSRPYVWALTGSGQSRLMP